MSKIVDGGSSLSRVASLKVMPRGVRPRTGTPSPGEEGIDAYIYKKNDTQIWMSFSIKVAMTYSPTNLCSTIGAVGLNFSVRDGKRWIPDAINRLNKGIDALHIVQCKSIFFTSSVMETLFSFLSDFLFCGFANTEGMAQSIDSLHFT